MTATMVAPEVDSSKVSAERKPTARQVYAFAHVAAELLGQEWPADRRSMSELIARMVGAKGSAASEECPF